MNKRIVVAAAFALLLAASAYAQTKDFFDLAQTGTPQDVQAAIKKGAKVNARDEDGWTPLMYAAAGNENYLVSIVLLAAGADIKAKAKDGTTPLMCAAGNQKNPENMIIALLDAGVDAKAKDNDGSLAIYYASFNPKLKGTYALRQLLKASQ